MSTTNTISRTRSFLSPVRISVIATFLSVVTAGAQLPGQMHWKDLGHGKPGAGGVPQLSATSAYLGQELRFDLSSGRPNSNVLFVLGVARADVQIAGNRVVPRFDLMLPAMTDGHGCASVTIRVPNMPQLDGMDLYLQALVADSQARVVSSPALKGFLFCPGNPFDEIACDFLKAEPEEGPKHKAWKAKLRQELVKALQAEGFTKAETSKIAKDGFRGIKGIIKNLLRLYKALRAIRKARKAAGPQPKFGE